MTPSELKVELDKLVRSGIQDPALIMGESGIGKTAVVSQVAAEHDLRVWDVRWGQLMPADARGVPVPKHLESSLVGTTVFYPPSFWPREGRGIIFLDEFNMATPAMMGLGQQLLLDRKFGDYVVPDGIVVWAAGNRKVDRAAVNEIPGPVNNRVAHYDVEHDFSSWELWAHSAGISVEVLGFLKWRTEYLHKFNPNQRAWPSPRSWEMADRRIKAGMSIAPVVGEAVCGEFLAYQEMRKHIPNIKLIIEGKGSSVKFPKEPSLKFATLVELTRKSMEVGFPAFVNAFKWAAANCGDEPDWTSFFVQDYVRLVRGTNPAEARKVLPQILAMPELRRFVQEQSAMGGLG